MAVEAKIKCLVDLETVAKMLGKIRSSLFVLRWQFEVGVGCIAVVVLMFLIVALGDIMIFVRHAERTLRITAPVSSAAIPTLDFILLLLRLDLLEFREASSEVHWMMILLRRFKL